MGQNTRWWGLTLQILWPYHQRRERYQKDQGWTDICKDNTNIENYQIHESQTKIDQRDICHLYYGYWYACVCKQSQPVWCY